MDFISKQLQDYAKNYSFDGYQLAEMRAGLEEGLDISVFAKPEYSFDQMREIRLGMSSGVNFLLYCVPEMHYSKMKAIREGLMHGVSSVEVKRYLNSTYNGPQLAQIFNGLIAGYNVKVYDNPSFTAQQMLEIYLGLKFRVDVSCYANPKIPPKQMKSIRTQMMKSRESAYHIIAEFAERDLNYFSAFLKWLDFSLPYRSVKQCMLAVIEVNKCIDEIHRSLGYPISKKKYNNLDQLLKIHRTKNIFLQ